MRLPNQSAGVRRTVFARPRRAGIVSAQMIRNMSPRLDLGRISDKGLGSKNTFFRAVGENRIKINPEVTFSVEGNQVMMRRNDGGSIRVYCDCAAGENCSSECYISVEDHTATCHGGCYTDKGKACTSCAMRADIFGGKFSL